MSELSEEEIARAIHKGFYEAGRQIAPGFPGDYLNPANKFSDEGVAYARLLSQARAVLALLQPALERARREERERCAVACEDEMPATQDMESTEICEALERAAAAIRKG